MQHVSWLVVCRCGARRRWSTTRRRSSRDVPHPWTWSGEGWTWGLDWRTRRPGDQPWWLTSRTSTSASVHGSDRVDQVKTVDIRVEPGSGRLGGLAGRGQRWHVSSGKGDVWSTLLATGFVGLGLKTQAEVPRRNGRHVAASRSLRRSKVTSWRAWWPSDVGYVELD